MKKKSPNAESIEMPKYLQIGDTSSEYMTLGDRKVGLPRLAHGSFKLSTRSNSLIPLHWKSIEGQRPFRTKVPFQEGVNLSTMSHENLLTNLEEKQVISSKKKKEVIDIVSHIKRKYIKTRLHSPRKSLFHQKYDELIDKSSPVFNRRKDSLISATLYKPKLETRTSFNLSGSTSYKIYNKAASTYSSVSDLKQRQVSKKLSSAFVKKFIRDQLSPQQRQEIDNTRVEDLVNGRKIMRSTSPQTPRKTETNSYDIRASLAKFQESLNQRQKERVSYGESLLTIKLKSRKNRFIV